MPSASAKLEKQTSTEAYDPMKQIVTIVEKKVRNLEKRKGKLDSYRQDSQNGKELNEDQKKAVEKYDLVVELLDFAKELQKQFHGVVQETTKAQKKAAKREQLERQQQELLRIKEIVVYQDLLNSMGGEDVRQDFLEGNKGAVKLSEEELNCLDELYKAICPERDPDPENNSEFDSTLSTVAEHIQGLLDAKNKEAFGTTYKSLRETLQKIYSCSYFNKSEDSPNETQSNLSEEKDDGKNFSELQSETNVDDFVMVPKNDEFVMVQKSVGTTPQAERPYYPMESSSLYTEQSHPIQEVLSGQGNLNFLQESQIEVESPTAVSQVPPNIPTASFANVQYPTPPQPMSTGNIVSQHRTRRPSEEAVALANHSAANMVLANSSSLQQQAQSIPPNVAMQPTTQPADFDPGRPIPTQTYTNQSFSSVVHPMMAVPQNYVPVTIPHALSPAHVLPANMVPLPPRNAVTSAPPMVANPMAATHTSVSGLSTASALSQQANIYSLCLKMNQLNSESSQPAHVSPQYDCNEIQESNVTKHTNTFGNGGGNHPAVDSRSRAGSNAYPRNAGQVDYENGRAYQSTNNSQAYMNRENFADNSSYSSNLKRGLNSRRTQGPNVPRGGNTSGGRVGYRN